MVDQNMEKRIRDAVNHATPDVLDKIYASCEEQKGKVIHMNNNIKSNKSSNRRKWYGPVAVAAAVLLVGIGGFGYNSWNISNTVNSVVMLDVNPSISLNVNGKERVVSVEARNEEGVKILGDMDLKDTDLEVAVNALIGSMLQNGYLTDLQNAILVSIEDEDATRGNNLQTKLSTMIEQILNNGQFESAVLSQRVTADSSVKELADRYDMSEGKAALIKELAEQDSTLTVEALASLSVQEIGVIMESKAITTKEVNQVGHASEKAYIGKEEAKKIAYTHAKIAEKDVTKVEIEFDTEDGVMVYEIEFDSKAGEYDYVIDAKVGTILQFEKELQDSNSGNNIIQTPSNQTPSNQTPSNSTDSSNYISKSKVKEITLSYAKVSETQVTNFELDLDDDDDNRMVYDVEFETKDAEYDVKVDAITGKVLDYKIDYHNARDNNNNQGNIQDNDDDDDQGETPKDSVETSKTSTKAPTTTPTKTADSYISKSQAKAAALNHAKLDETKIQEYEIELDENDDDKERAVYEIQFKQGNKEYEYEIDAFTGVVLESDTEIDD